MKKILLSLVAVFCVLFSKAQFAKYQKFPQYGAIFDKMYIPTFLGIPNDTLLIPSGAEIYPHVALKNNVFYFWNTVSLKWEVLSGGGGGGGSDVLRYGGAITSLPVAGYAPNTTIMKDWTDSVFYQAQPPTATLTGGVAIEFQAAGTLNYTLNYTSGRQLSTNPISTIVVAGVNKTFTQPAPGASVSGTQAVSFPANTSITFSNVTTATDGKQTIVTTSFPPLPKRYFGWVSAADTAGIGTVGYDDTKITSLGSELTASKSKTINTGNPTGTQFYVYAYYYTAGALTNVDLNGFPSLAAFNVSQRNLTNALGFTGQWFIYWNKNGQTSASSITVN